MTKNDLDLICKLYRDALHKDEQITIITQLYLIPPKRVKQILCARGLIETEDSELYNRIGTLYTERRTDYEIASICHVPTEFVKEWRDICGYKPNKYRRRVYENKR